MTIITQDFVFAQGHELKTDSLKVAKAFNKEHKNVLRDIQSLIEKIPAEIGRLMFEQSNYLNCQNKSMPMYEMTKDGFMLLVMGYSTAEALQIKLERLVNDNPELASMAKKVVTEKIPDGATLVCDKCSVPIRSGSQFCPNCGDPVDINDVVSVNSVATQYKENVIFIRFGYSSSAHYSRAVSISKNIPDYKEDGEGKNITHSLSLPITEIELVINLYEIVGSWKSSTFHLNSKQIAKSDLTQGALGCYRNCRDAYNQQDYCWNVNQYSKNIFGCRRIRMEINNWGGGWIEYGHFDNRNIWHFDKDRILHELKNNISKVTDCPFFNADIAMEAFMSIPNTVNPNVDDGWGYKYNYTYDRETFESTKEIVGIAPSESVFR